MYPTIDYVVNQTAYFPQRAYSKQQYDQVNAPPLIKNNNNPSLYFSAAKKDTYRGNSYHDDAGSDYFTQPFTPSIFLAPGFKEVIPKNHEQAIGFAQEAFRLMTGKELPENVLIEIHPRAEFRLIHSRFGRWDEGIRGFSINGHERKLIFIRETDLCSMLITIGHEIGHVNSDTLPNAHDEEAKAFAFTIEWANILKKSDIGGVGSSIKDEFTFNPAKNGLHDIAFAFVDFMAKNGRKSLELHDDLVKKYVSIFNPMYNK